MSEMTLEEAFNWADAYGTKVEHILAAEVRRLQALAYPPQDGTEFAKIPYKDHHAAAAALAAENDQRIGELQAENARLRQVVGTASTTESHVWTETPMTEVVTTALDGGRVEVKINTINGPSVGVEIAPFRLDLLMGPIVRQWLKYREAAEKGVGR